MDALMTNYCVSAGRSVSLSCPVSMGSVGHPEHRQGWVWSGDPGRAPHCSSPSLPRSGRPCRLPTSTSCPCSTGSVAALAPCPCPLSQQLQTLSSLSPGWPLSNVLPSSGTATCPGKRIGCEAQAVSHPCPQPVHCLTHHSSEWSTRGRGQAGTQRPGSDHPAPFSGEHHPLRPQHPCPGCQGRPASALAVLCSTIRAQPLPSPHLQGCPCLEQDHGTARGKRGAEMEQGWRWAGSMGTELGSRQAGGAPPEKGVCCGSAVDSRSINKWILTFDSHGPGACGPAGSPSPEDATVLLWSAPSQGIQHGVRDCRLGGALPHGWRGEGTVTEAGWGCRGSPGPTAAVHGL